MALSQTSAESNFHSDSVKLGPTFPQSVYNRVTVQLCLIVSQSQHNHYLARDKKVKKGGTNTSIFFEDKHIFVVHLNVSSNQID